MKKIKLTVAVLVLTTAMSATITAEAGVTNAIGAQNVTEEIEISMEPEALIAAFKESAFSTNTDALLPTAFQTGENSSSLVIEKNETVKTTKKKAKKKKKKKKKVKKATKV